MSGLILNGDTSGSVTLNVPAVAGSSTVTLPSTTGNISVLPTGYSLGAGDTTRFKNRIINGDMRIDQRNAGASVIPSVNPQYLVDRFAVENSVASKFAYQQNAGSVTPPNGFNNYLGATSQSAYSIGSGDYFLLQQRIEGFNVADLHWGTANAKTITLSFWVRSSLTGTFGGNLQNSANNRFYPYSYTISAANTWEQKTIIIAGDTTGTWEKTTSTGIMIRWSLGTGSTYLGSAGSWGATAYLGVTGQTNAVGTNGATFYITGVQLEVGSQATSFEYRDYGDQLRMCQRYYQALEQFYGVKTPSGYTRINIRLPAAMRTAPSVTFNDAVGNASKISIYYGNDARTDNVGAISVAGASTTQFQLLPNNADSAPGYVFSASMSAEL